MLDNNKLVYVSELTNKNLKNINIKEKVNIEGIEYDVKFINDRAFMDTSIESVIIPNIKYNHFFS